MDIRKYCDDVEVKVKKLNYEKEVLVQDSEFLDYELRDGKEQNIQLKLNLSKELTKLDSTTVKNEQARADLENFIRSFNQSIQFDPSL